MLLLLLLLLQVCRWWQRRSDQVEPSELNPAAHLIALTCITTDCQIRSDHTTARSF